MVRPLLFGLGMMLVGCATGDADLGGSLPDGGRPDSSITTDTTGSGCGSGLSKCGSDCADLAFDRENCGACGKACTGSEVCKAGKCSSDCGTLTSCPSESGAKCVNTSTDAANCGSCGKVCPSGQLCSSGTCAPDCGTLTRCPGATPYCADTKTDLKNCGYCGNACPTGQECIAGTCGLLCMPPTTKCGGACTNTSTDPMNCGACAVACSLANATAGCSGGTCTVASCNSGYGNCDMVASNGCETNTSNDVGNCGGCGTTCSVANGTAACSGGSCSVASCNPNYGNCDGSASNGCEVNHLTNNSHCGSCSNACPSGQTCRTGACATSSVTNTRTVDYTGAGCVVCTGGYLCPTTPLSQTFVDPSPSGSRVVTISVSVYGVGCGASPVTVRVNGTTIGTFSPSAGCMCSTCDPPYVVSLTNGAGIPGYIVGGTNTLTIVPSGGTPCLDRSEVTITTG